MPVLITALNEDTAFELDVVLDRRRLVSVAIVDGDLRLLGADRYFASTFRADNQLGSFPPGQFANEIETSVQDVNNRLKQLLPSP